MNKIFQLIPLIFVMLTNSCASPVNNSNVSIDQIINSPTTCYKEFPQFAYEVIDSGFPVESLAPADPWQVEADLSDKLIENDLGFSGIDVMFARSVNGSSEIWLARPTKHQKEDVSSVVVYQMISKEWRFIPDVIAGTDVFVSDIFLTSDGSIWGRNTWGWEKISPSSGPVLSKFNENTRQFEFASGALEVPYNDEQRFVNIEILVDKQDTFWLFVENDGLYHYDPISQQTTKQINLRGINGASPVLSADGSIYFKDDSYEKYALNNPNFSVFKEMLFKFIPATGELIELEIPNEPWPIFGDMFMTQSGQLWLGSIGYREPNGSWYLVHSDINLYFEHAGDIAWISPNIMLESSDGRLWLKKYIDSGLRNEGTAWYDPKTGEGCMFTNIPSNIIEDSQQQLWMFADGKLYRYSLEQ